MARHFLKQSFACMAQPIVRVWGRTVSQNNERYGVLDFSLSESFKTINGQNSKL